MPPDSPDAPRPRKICYVTGTRAEFGLMQRTLKAIASHPALTLQLVVTGMHLDRSRGQSLQDIRGSGLSIDAIIPWKASSASPAQTAAAMGAAIGRLAKTFEQLRPDIVLVTGDRVEAFAAAAAAHVGGLLVGHVHGGDRALGLVDDALRHAITKLAHLHFPATEASARRIEKLGEDRRRIRCVGSPGLDGIFAAAARWPALRRRFPGLQRRRFGLLALHPESNDSARQRRFAGRVMQSAAASSIAQWVVVYPNNDPGSDGIAQVWEAISPRQGWWLCRHLPRGEFLGLLRESAMLIGNSSSGIIEAASFGVGVVDIGNRQLGRERGENVLHAAANRPAIARAIDTLWNHGAPRQFKHRNIYGSGATAAKITRALASVRLQALRQKLISY